MPNRIIKESLLTSDKIASLSDFEFRLWIGLILCVDDAGRGDARPAIIKGRAFPLRERVTLKDIEKAIHSLAAKGCVSLYTVDGKPYFWFPTWGDHQRIRDARPKYPAPETAIFETLPQLAAVRGGLPPESNPIQSETESEFESESNPPIPSRNGGQGAAGDFDRFWAVYPRKVGKQDALRKFQKVKVPVEVLIAAVERQKKSAQWQKEGGQFIPHPATWLNQGRWEDEVETACWSGSDRHTAPPTAREEMAQMEKYLQELRTENGKQQLEDPDGEAFG